MCGICGIAGDDDGTISNRLALMCKTLHHRGPDGQGSVCFKGAGLGHTRLSIIDVAGGGQPLGNEDGSIYVTFNGEIFNHQELRKRLLAAGHVFLTHADTEVIVHAYEEFGMDFLQHLNGQFAFGLWDVHRERLFLARDRVGIKSLYYQGNEQSIIFGSELKALLCDPKLQRRIDPRALLHFFTYLYIPSPLSIFEGVRKLPPGHFLLWEKGRLQLTRYWQCPEPGSGGDEPRREDWVATLDDAVRSQLMSEVPLGVFLSGGIDSSTIAWFARKHTESRLRTFSIRFPGGEDESPFAQEVAKALGSEHETLELTPGNTEDEVRHLLAHFDEPFGDTSAIPTFFLCKMARRRVTVCLSGDGGDELFGGYRRYLSLYEAMRRPWRKSSAEGLVRRLRDISGGMKWIARCDNALAPPADKYLRRMALTFGTLRRQMFAQDLGIELETATDNYLKHFFDGYAPEELPARMLHADFHTFLPEFVLVKVDRMSMFHGLEVRVPFLDHRLVEQVARLPLESKTDGRSFKIALKKAMCGKLPAKILERRKTGFGLPLNYWFRKGFSSFASEILANRRSVREGHLNARFFDHLREDTNSQKHCRQLVWALVVWEIWLENQGMGKP